MANTLREADLGKNCFGRVKGKNIPGKPAKNSGFFEYVSNHPYCAAAKTLTKLSKVHKDTTGIEIDFISKFDDYNMKPPTGAHIERSCLDFYLQRAAPYRAPESTLSEIYDYISSEQAELDYNVYYNIVAQNTVENCVSNFDQLFELHDGAWMLKVELFNKAIRTLPPDSSPGYPYAANGFSKNRDLAFQDPDDQDLLYGAVNDYMIMLCTTEFDKALDFVKDMDHVSASRFLYECGYVLPAMVFIKMEPTKKSKVARTIQGLSVIASVITKLLLGDYLRALPARWDVATHKVGLDFNTDEGKLKLAEHYASMHETKDYLNHISKGDNYVIVTSDVEGYEWVATKPDASLFWTALSDSYRDISPYQSLLIKKVGCVDLLSTVCIDTEGYVHSIPHYILMSGKFVTHFQNSVTRAKQAIKAAGIKGDFALNIKLLKKLIEETEYSERANLCKDLEAVDGTLNLKMFNSLCETNGDDCANVQHRDTIVDKSFSTIDFMKVTDVEILERDVLKFSSQMFVLSKEFFHFRSNPNLKTLLNGSLVKRYPDSFMKAILRMPEVAESEEAIAGLMLHFIEHPGRIQYFDLINDYKRWLDSKGEPEEERPTAIDLVKKMRLAPATNVLDLQKVQIYVERKYDEYVKECNEAKLTPLGRYVWIHESLELGPLPKFSDKLEFQKYFSDVYQRYAMGMFREWFATTTVRPRMQYQEWLHRQV